METSHLWHLWKGKHHTENRFVPHHLPNSTVKTQNRTKVTISKPSVQNSENQTPLPSSLGTPETNSHWSDWWETLPKPAHAHFQLSLVRLLLKVPKLQSYTNNYH